MRRPTPSIHHSINRWRPRFEGLESGHLLSSFAVAVDPPSIFPPAPPVQIPGPPGGVAVDPPAVLPPSPPAGSPGPSGGVTVDPPPSPPGGVTVDPPPVVPPVTPPGGSGFLNVVAVDPPSGAHLTTPPTVLTVTFDQSIDPPSLGLG